MAAFDYESVRANLPALETRIWPAARLLKLVDAHEQETPFKEIAKAIGGGATKSGCISQAHRIKLPNRNPYDVQFRPAQYQTTRKPKPEKPAKVVRPPKLSTASVRHTKSPEVAAALALPGLSRVLISALEATQCRWPVGDPRHADFSFCGRLKAEAGPYCAAHAAAARSPDAGRVSRGGLERLARITGPIRQRSGAWA